MFYIRHGFFLSAENCRNKTYSILHKKAQKLDWLGDESIPKTSDTKLFCCWCIECDSNITLNVVLL